MNYRKLIFTMLTLLLIFGVVQAPEAALNAVDPGPYTAATGGYPAWYQDTNGVALELCLSKTLSPGGGFMCPLLATPDFNPALPIVFPTNFSDENFWFTADGRVRDSGVGPRFDFNFVIALEAAFGAGAVNDGDQVSFARIRIRASLDTPGVYTITHPYGIEVIEATETGTKAINMTRDIGIGGPGDFTGALSGDIGPFLVSTNAQGVVSPIVIGAETFVGDPNVTTTFTGSPFGTNYFRVQGPGGIDATSNIAAISGKVFKGATLPTPVVVDRTSYSSSEAGTQMDVFAIGPAPAAVSFTDSVANIFPMGGDLVGRFFGQATVPPSVLGPVSLTASATPFNNPAFPANAPATVVSPITDLVSITRAEYSIVAQTLVIEASSSDQLTPPALSNGAAALTMTVVPPVQSLTVTGLVVPPATVTVTSSAGGTDTEAVAILP